jgi:hypothetical protein
MLRRRGGRAGRPGLIGTMARTAVVAGTASAVSGSVSRQQQARAQQEADAAAYRQQQATAAQQPPVQPVAASSVSDVVTQLKELAALKDQGILTEEEFATQKARVLGS